MKVNRKDLAIESFYGYLNIHLELLHQGITENNTELINFQKNQLKKVRNALTKLGYFERNEEDETSTYFKESI